MLHLGRAEECHKNQKTAKTQVILETMFVTTNTHKQDKKEGENTLLSTTEPPK